MIDSDIFAELLDAPGLAISIYLPLQPEQRDLRAPEARLRGLIAAVEAMLERDGLDERVRQDALRPLREATGSIDFASHRDPTLALFGAPSGVRDVALPVALPAGAFVGRHWYLKPLLPMLAANRRFDVLALSKTRARLLAATPYSLQEQALDYLPVRAQAAIDSQKESGALLDAEHEDAERQALQIAHPQRLAAAIRAAVGTAPAPLLLVADPQVAGSFAGHPAMAGLIYDTLALNPFALSDGELHDRATQAMQPVLAAELDGVLDQITARLGAAEPNVAVRFEEILTAAREGRVETIVVAQDETLWGNPGGGPTLSVHGSRGPHDEDLLNVAAVLTLRQGGRAFAVPVERLPRHVPAAALLRY